MNSVFKGKRPVMGSLFALSGANWVVVAIAPGIVVGRREGVEIASSVDDLTIVREVFS